MKIASSFGAVENCGTLRNNFSDKAVMNSAAIALILPDAEEGKGVYGDGAVEIDSHAGSAR